MALLKHSGKELTKEEAMKRSYFGIFFRHFFDLFRLNLLYVACNLVFIIAFIWLSLPYLFNLDMVLSQLLSEQMILIPPEPFIPFLFMGPFIAGLTYVLRNWSRQEHAFIVYDFFDQTKENWKQSLLLSVLGTVFTYIFANAVLFYIKAGLPSIIILPIAGFIGIILVSMSFYTYPMIVTFQMGLKDILVNAWIFAMAKLPQNIFYMIVIGLVHIILISNLPVFWAILMVCILICWTGYTINFYVWNVLDKYIIERMEPVNEDGEEEETF